jgi:hypothetical protein
MVKSSSLTSATVASSIQLDIRHDGSHISMGSEARADYERDT